MSVLQHLKDGFVTAAQLAALLFVPPTFASEPLIDDARASRIEIAIQDDRAHVTLSRRIHNDGASMLDLARHLPTVDHQVASLRVVRAARAIDLITEGDCGEDPGVGVESAHVRMALDEAVADALRLAPGDTAWIEIAATRPLPASSAVERLDLPWHAGIASQAIAAERADGTFALLIAPHAETRGMLVLQLRPNGRPTQRIELGVVEAPGTVFVIALERDALNPLAAGAVELEARREDELFWATLPLQVTGSVPALAVDASR